MRLELILVLFGLTLFLGHVYAKNNPFYVNSDKYVMVYHIDDEFNTLPQLYIINPQNIKSKNIYVSNGVLTISVTTTGRYKWVYISPENVYETLVNKTIYYIKIETHLYSDWTTNSYFTMDFENFSLCMKSSIDAKNIYPHISINGKIVYGFSSTWEWMTEKFIFEGGKIEFYTNGKLRYSTTIPLWRTKVLFPAHFAASEDFLHTPTTFKIDYLRIFATGIPFLNQSKIM